MDVDLWWKKMQFKFYNLIALCLVVLQMEKKLSALCEINHLDIAPHHDCYIHAPLVASSPSGRIVESFDNERDPLQGELFENHHKMSNGWIHINENPGLGLEISETALKKFGKLVYKNK